MPIDAGRLIIEVMAGVILGIPMPEKTKRWGITSGEWEAADDKVALLKERTDLAFEYARDLQDPREVNWVRVDWLWL